MGKPAFDVYIGIHYSGAQTPISSLKALRVYSADWVSPAIEVQPPPSPRKYWTRRGLAEWLVEALSKEHRVLVGLNHGFSFPLQYFQYYRLPNDWPAFLDDFQIHWPTDADHTYVDFVLDGVHGNGAARRGNPLWCRLTEKRAGTGRTVFNYDVQGSATKSTHAGLPWLRYLRQHLAGAAHFWPFDGWQIPANCSVIAEVQPTLWHRAFAPETRSREQHDAYSAAMWMRRADSDGSLTEYFQPNLSPAERATAEIEGWILGLK